MRANPERARVWYAEQVHAGDWRERVDRTGARPPRLSDHRRGRLDPAIVPATGTPEPDGLTWRETLDILRTVTEHATSWAWTAWNWPRSTTCMLGLRRGQAGVQDDHRTPRGYTA